MSEIIGTVLWVDLPTAAEEADPSTLEAAPSKIMRGSETTLLVEDAAPLRDLTRNSPKRSDTPCYSRGDGKRAKQIADRGEATSLYY